MMIAKGLSSSLLLVQLLGALVSGKAISNTPLYKDASAPIEKRIEDLLGRMTTEEKMAQLMQGKFMDDICNEVSGFHYRSDCLFKEMSPIGWTIRPAHSTTVGWWPTWKRRQACSMVCTKCSIALETLCNIVTRYSRISNFLGLVDGEYQARPGLFDAEYHPWYSCSCSIGR